MAPESKQSFLFTGVRAHARLQFRLRHPPRFIVPQLIRLSYRRNTVPPLRSIKFANRPGEIRRDSRFQRIIVPTKSTLSRYAHSLKQRERKKRENSRSTTKMISSILRGATSILFSFFFFFRSKPARKSITRFIDSRTRSGRDEVGQIEKRRGGGERRGGLCSLDSISNLRSLCPMPPTSSWRKEKEREPAGIPVISIQEAL